MRSTSASPLPVGRSPSPPMRAASSPAPPDRPRPERSARRPAGRAHDGVVESPDHSDDENRAQPAPDTTVAAGTSELSGISPRQLLHLATRAPDSYVLLLVLLLVDYVSLNVEWTGPAALIVRAALFAVTVLLAFHTSRVPVVVQ